MLIQPHVWYISRQEAREEATGASQQPECGLPQTPATHRPLVLLRPWTGTAADRQTETHWRRWFRPGGLLDQNLWRGWRGKTLSFCLHFYKFVFLLYKCIDVIMHLYVCLLKSHQAQYLCAWHPGLFYGYAVMDLLQSKIFYPFWFYDTIYYTFFCNIIMFARNCL